MVKLSIYDCVYLTCPMEIQYWVSWKRALIPHYHYHCATMAQPKWGGGIRGIQFPPQLQPLSASEKIVDMYYLKCWSEDLNVWAIVSSLNDHSFSAAKHSPKWCLMVLPSIALTRERAQENHPSSSALIGLNLALKLHEHLKPYIFVLLNCRLKYRIRNTEINLHEHPDSNLNPGELKLDPAFL